MTKYKIFVKTLQGVIIPFSVDHYTVDKAGFVCFINPTNNEPKKFHSSNCEINEVGE